MMESHTYSVALMKYMAYLTVWYQFLQEEFKLFWW